MGRYAGEHLPECRENHCAAQAAAIAGTDLITVSINSLSGWLDSCIDDIPGNNTHVSSLDWLRDYLTEFPLDTIAAPGQPHHHREDHTMTTDLKMGIYRHYKGPLHQVMGLTHDANHTGRVCALYFALDLDPTHLGPQLATRTLSDFTSHVITNPDCSAYGETVRPSDDPFVGPRFAYLGPHLTADMLTPTTEDAR